jgi:cytochrome bd-type quinol oxidase subunit 2
VLLVVASTVATVIVQPNIVANLRGRPWTAIFAIGTIAGIALSAVLARRGQRMRAFHASSLAIASLFACACVGVHPYGLIARIPERSVLAVDAAADFYALGVGLAWWVPGMTAVVAYSIFAHRRLLNGAAH